MSIPKQESVEFFGRKSFSCYIYRRNWQWERVISLNTNNSVYINIYTNLSEAHVLSLYQQNELHQISQKEFSFCAKVIIFLIAFMKKKEKHAESHRNTVLWDGGIILNKSVRILFTGTYLIFLFLFLLDLYINWI